MKAKIISRGTASKGLKNTHSKLNHNKQMLEMQYITFWTNIHARQQSELGILALKPKRLCICLLSLYLEG